MTHIADGTRVGSDIWYVLYEVQMAAYRRLAGRPLKRKHTTCLQAFITVLEYVQQAEPSLPVQLKVASLLRDAKIEARHCPTLIESMRLLQQPEGSISVKHTEVLFPLVDAIDAATY